MATNEADANPQGCLASDAPALARLQDRLIMAIGLMACASITGAWIGLLLWGTLHVIGDYL
jgi:hypothetical protein